MQLTHIAIWTNELERSRDFYIKYFNGKSNEKYVNPKKGFASYFVTFEGGASLEIMQRTDITKETADVFFGLAHFAFSTRLAYDLVTVRTELFDHGIHLLFRSGW